MPCGARLGTRDRLPGVPLCQEPRDIPHWWHLWQVPGRLQRSGAPGQWETQPKIIKMILKMMRNTDPAGERHRLDLPHGSATSSCPICSPSVPHPATCPYLPRCQRCPAAPCRAGRARGARGASGIPLPGGSRRAGTDTGTVPLPAAFKGAGRELHPSPRVFWQRDARRATAGRGCDAGSWERWPGSQPSVRKQQTLPEGPLFLCSPPRARAHRPTEG